MSEVVVRRVDLVTSVEEADKMLGQIEKGLRFHTATWLILAELILEFDETKGWEQYQDHEGKRMYRNVWRCLEAKVLKDLRIGKAGVMSMRRAGLAFIQVFKGITALELHDAYPKIPWDERSNHPVLSQRAMLKLSMLNDYPKEQLRAFELAMQATNGALTEDAVAFQVARLLPSAAEDTSEIVDQKLREWMGLMLTSVRANVDVFEDDPELAKKVPKKVRKALRKAADLIDTFYRRLKAP